MSKSGWLWKEGESGLRWKRRFFELGGTNLMYYEDDTKATKRGTTSLVTSKIRNTKGARPGKFAFRIDLGADHKPHKLVLAADTLMETEEWVAALEALGIESSFNPMPLAQQTNAPAASRGAACWRAPPASCPPTRSSTCLAPRRCFVCLHRLSCIVRVLTRGTSRQVVNFVFPRLCQHSSAMPVSGAE